MGPTVFCSLVSWVPYRWLDQWVEWLSRVHHVPRGRRDGSKYARSFKLQIMSWKKGVKFRALFYLVIVVSILFSFLYIFYHEDETPNSVQLSHSGHKHGGPENTFPLMEKQLTKCPNQALAAPGAPSCATPDSTCAVSASSFAHLVISRC